MVHYCKHACTFHAYVSQVASAVQTSQDTEGICFGSRSTCSVCGVQICGRVRATQLFTSHTVSSHPQSPKRGTLTKTPDWELGVLWLALLKIAADALLECYRETVFHGSKFSESEGSFLFSFHMCVTHTPFQCPCTHTFTGVVTVTS